MQGSNNPYAAFDESDSSDDGRTCTRMSNSFNSAVVKEEQTFYSESSPKNTQSLQSPPSMECKSLKTAQSMKGGIQKPLQQEESFDYQNYGENTRMYYQLEKRIAPFRVLSGQDLFHQLNTFVHNLSQQVGLPHDWALLLGQQLGYDFDNLWKYFEDGGIKYRKVIGVDRYAVTNQSGWAQIPGVGQCGVCLSQDVTLWTPGLCHHRFCLPCWTNYIEAMINSQQPPFLKCIENNCKCPLLHSTVNFILDHNKWLKQSYNFILAKHFCKISKQFRPCIGINCSKYIELANPEALETSWEVTCTCKKVFCFLCNSDSHFPCSCQEKDEWVKKAEKEEATAYWLVKNTKTCPSCQNSVERSAGCNKIQCKCGKSFCFQCSKEWEPIHTDHFNCPEKMIEDKKDKEEKQKNQKQKQQLGKGKYVSFKYNPLQQRALDTLKKMDKYQQRYFYNKKSLEHFRKFNHFSVRSDLKAKLGISIGDTGFLPRAFELACQFCEITMWLSVLNYFHTGRLEKEKQFVPSMNIFEGRKQMLCAQLANQLKNIVVALQKVDRVRDETQFNHLVQKFTNFKESVVDLCSVTLKEKLKLEDELKKIIKVIEADKMKGAKNIKHSIK